MDPYRLPTTVVPTRYDLHLAPDNPKRLVIGLKKLGPGTYTVKWHVVSVDTHHTEGTFTFSVQP